MYVGMVSLYFTSGIFFNGNKRIVGGAWGSVNVFLDKTEKGKVFYLIYTKGFTLLIK